MSDRKVIYNPQSRESVNERQIISGNPTGLIELTKVKYQWAINLWDVMLAITRCSPPMKSGCTIWCSPS